MLAGRLLKQWTFKKRVLSLEMRVDAANHQGAPMWNYPLPTKKSAFLPHKQCQGCRVTPSRSFKPPLKCGSNWKLAGKKTLTTHHPYFSMQIFRLKHRYSVPFDLCWKASSAKAWCRSVGGRGGWSFPSQLNAESYCRSKPLTPFCSIWLWFASTQRGEEGKNKFCRSAVLPRPTGLNRCVLISLHHVHAAYCRRLGCHPAWKKKGEKKKQEKAQLCILATWPLPFSERHATVYLQQPGVQQQRVGRLRVVVTLFVEVAELVEVPGTEQRVRHVAQTHNSTPGLQAQPEVGANDQSTWTHRVSPKKWAWLGAATSRRIHSFNGYYD